jgi:ATP-dependent phosphofructokinase / diphosphate-dependent phosphofructokinase
MTQGTRRAYAVMTRKNAFYAQSGGVTAVINASACGVLQTARQHSEEIGKVYAGRNGIIGALTEDLIGYEYRTRIRDRRAQTHSGCGVRILSLQAHVDSRAQGAVRSLDRSLSGA